MSPRIAGPHIGHRGLDLGPIHRIITGRQAFGSLSLSTGDASGL